MSYKHSPKTVIFTWHVHGSYLYYLSLLDIEIYIPYAPEKKEGYWGRGETFPFGDNVKEISLEEIPHRQFDCILFQSSQNFLIDQYAILSEQQRMLPRIYLEHNAPDGLDALHPMNDTGVMLVHVTHFNHIMWNNQTLWTMVIEHGVEVAEVEYTGQKAKGLVITNHLYQRGWSTGADIFDRLKKTVPLDLIGMGTAYEGGIGEVLHPALPYFVSHYRFLFNPIRWTSLGLSVIEAMMIGLPVVSLNTTEYATVIRNGENGFISNNLAYLQSKMELLLKSPELARDMGAQARKDAQERFGIPRFRRAWQKAIQQSISFNQKNMSYATNDRIY